jgi:hypothetical protein
MFVAGRGGEGYTRGGLFRVERLEILGAEPKIDRSGRMGRARRMQGQTGRAGLKSLQPGDWNLRLNPSVTR